MKWVRTSLVIAAVALMGGTRTATADLVVNGDFELKADGTTPSVVGQVNVGGRTLQAWTVGAPQNSTQANAFAFVVDSNADSTGFPSENSPPNIQLWGPNSGSNNGFTGSPTGGKFLGVSGDYATSTVSQTINGLLVGQQYTVSFDWAGSQFTDQSGVTTQWWQVGFAGSNQDTTHTPVASQGFTGWLNASMTFTATSNSDTLVLTAKATPFTNGAPAGLAPFLLIDGVSVTALSPPPGVPEPGTWIGMVVGGLVLGGLRRRRRARVDAGR